MLDLENLRLPEIHALLKAPAKFVGHPRRHAPFLKGPVPLDWFQEAMGLGIGAVSVGIILWYFTGLKKSKSFKVGIADIAHLINRSWRTAHRGLNTLEHRDLITLERHPGRKHFITILEVKEHANLKG